MVIRWSVLASWAALLATSQLTPLAGDERTRWIEPVLCTGRVVVANGSPEGAEVYVIPSETTLKLSGWDLPTVSHAWTHAGRLPGLLPADALFAQAVPVWASGTTVGADGSFAVEFPHAFLRRDSRIVGVSMPTVLVRHDGCVTQVLTKRVSRRAGNELARLSLGPVALPPEGRLTGRIVDELGRPVEAVSVHHRWKGHPEQNAGLIRMLERFFPARFMRWSSTRTDASGRFELNALSSPARQVRHSLALDHVGFLSRVIDLDSVGSGQAVELGDIELTVGGVVRGNITDVSGRPIAGVILRAGPGPLKETGGCPSGYYYADDDTILMQLRRLRTGVPRAVTDDEGRFVLAGIADDLDWIYAEADGYEPVRAPWEQTSTLVLSPEAALHVRFVDEVSGEPVLGELAAGRSPAEDLRWMLSSLSVETLADGSHLVHRAGALATRLAITAAGYGSVTYAAPGVAFGETLELVVPLPRQAVLRGQVLDPSGEPLAGQVVTVRGATAWPRGTQFGERRAKTDASGRWVLDGLGPGTTYVEVRTDALPSLTRKLELTAGETRELTLALEAYAQLQVSVEDESGALAPGIEVQARPASHAYGYRKGVTDKRGQVALRVLPGQHHVVVKTSTVATINVGSGETRALKATLGSAPSVSLRLTAGGAPLPGDHLHLTRVDDDEPVRLRSEGTDAGGWTSVDLPFPGQWEIASQRRPSEVLGSVELDRGEHIELQLQMPEHVLEGVVEDLAGRPVPGARIGLTLQGEPVATMIAKDGRFAMPWLAPGSYDVSAHGAFLPFEQHVEVGATGHLTEVTLRVDRGAAVDGRLVGFSGCEGPPVYPGTNFRVEVVSLATGDVVSHAGVADCAFRVRGLGPGSYRLNVILTRRRALGVGSRHTVKSTVASLDIELEAREQKPVDIERGPR